MTDTPTPPKRPCGSCPYRCDVPSGIWAAEEYLKLPVYDEDIPQQLFEGATGLFMCHQRDGHLCGGWLACHGSDALAVRIWGLENDISDWLTYDPGVPVFSSGFEACHHGLERVADPDARALRVIRGLTTLFDDKPKT